MTKEEAVREFVSRELNAVSQDWVKIVAENEGRYPKLPMWGTMWIIDSWLGEKLMEGSRAMAYSPESIDLDSIEDKKERAKVKKAIKDEDYFITEYYYDEEMAYERCVLDKDGDPTALFIYEVGDEYVIGVNGAGWSFYDGVWDRLYDVLGLKWHKEEECEK